MVEHLQTPSDPGTVRPDAGGPGAPQPVSGRPAPAALAPSGPVEGYIEDVQDRRVIGWAWCRSRPNDPVEVEIRVGDETLAAVRADRFRGDLAKAGLSEGRHAFEAALDCTLSAEQKTRLTAHARPRAGDPWVPLVNRTRRAAAKGGEAAEGAAPQPARPASDAAAVLSWPEAVEALRQGHLQPRAEMHDLLFGPAQGMLLARAARIEGLGFGVEPTFEALLEARLHDVEDTILRRVVAAGLLVQRLAGLIEAGLRHRAHVLRNREGVTSIVSHSCFQPAGLISPAP